MADTNVRTLVQLDNSVIALGSSDGMPAGVASRPDHLDALNAAGTAVTQTKGQKPGKRKLGALTTDLSLALRNNLWEPTSSKRQKRALLEKAITRETPKVRPAAAKKSNKELAEDAQHVPIGEQGGLTSKKAFEDFRGTHTKRRTEGFRKRMQFLARERAAKKKELAV
ncbi:hypothetical protein LTR86_003299 [Recurvomyces mirabilis]|nr:hypothetical protein LTR86_003299 [Recurvomyces mirabilis]